MIVDYRSWQPAGRLRRLQEKKFLAAHGRMQWWYFDVLLEDGGVLVLAFIPRKWWREGEASRTDDAFLCVSLAGTDGKVSSFTRTFPAARIQGTRRGVEIPGELSIAFDAGEGRAPLYRLTFQMEGFRGELALSPLAKPFSPFPLGTLPGLARTLFEGAPLGAPGFSYVAQVPHGSARGTVTFGGRRVEVRGTAYHEQGRLADRPERLSRGWLWFHFMHPEWSVFGCPGVFIHVQEKEKTHLSGVKLFAHDYGIGNLSVAGVPPHPKIFRGGEVRVSFGGRTLRLTAEPGESTNLISFPAVDTKQIWSTSVSPATLELEGGGEARSLAGRMILETCWLAP